MKPAHLAIGALATFLLGSQVAAGKYAFPELPPFLFVALRFTLAALCFAAIVRLPRSRREWLAWFTIGTASGAVNIGLLYLGLYYTDAAVAGVAHQLQVPFGVLLAVIFLGERLRLIPILGIVVAFVGVGIIAGQPQKESVLFGIAMVAVSAFASALGNLFAKKLAPLDPKQLNAGMSIVAAIELFAFSAIIDGNPIPYIAGTTWVSWVALLYAGVLGAAVAFGLWFWLLGQYPLAKVAPLSLLIPLSAAGTGIVVLGESVTVSTLVGGALVISGIALVQMADRVMALWRPRRA